MLFILKRHGSARWVGRLKSEECVEFAGEPVADPFLLGLAWGLQITLIRVRRRHFSHNEVGLCITTFGPL